MLDSTVLPIETCINIIALVAPAHLRLAAKGAQKRV